MSEFYTWQIGKLIRDFLFRKLRIQNWNMRQLVLQKNMAEISGKYGINFG